MYYVRESQEPAPLSCRRLRGSSPRAWDGWSPIVYQHHFPYGGGRGRDWGLTHTFKPNAPIRVNRLWECILPRPKVPPYWEYNRNHLAENTGGGRKLGAGSPPRLINFPSLLNRVAPFVNMVCSYLLNSILDYLLCFWDHLFEHEICLVFFIGSREFGTV